jgi:hypothetical protein
VLALKALQSNSSSASYNLGTGNGFSVRDVIQTASAVTGRTIPLKRAPAGRVILRGWWQMRPEPKASSGGSRSITKLIRGSSISLLNTKRVVR